ncbi:hypothetical protein Tco_1497926, partial [Tanacetum coccineum]
MVRQSEEEVVTEQSKKVKKRRLQKQSDALPAKKLRTDHPALTSGAGGKTLAGLEQIRPAGSRLPDREQFVFPSVDPPSQESEGFLDSSARTNLRICTTVEIALAIPIDTTVAATTSTGAAVTTKLAMDINPDLAGPSHPEESEGSRTKHELELKEKLRVRYDARGRLLEEKDLEILKLKSKLAEKEAKAAEVIRLHDQVSSLFEEKSALTAEVSVLRITVTQKDRDISLLDSRATSLASTLDNAKVTCTEAEHKITSLASERDRLASEVQQEQQAQELYNRVAELEAHIMDVSGRLEGLALLKYLKSPEYQGILGHALGRAVNFGMQEGLEAGHEHGIARRSLSVVDAYNPEAAKTHYVDAVKALEDVDFPLVSLLKSKKDAGMDEVLDSFLLDGPLAGLPEAAYLQPCIEQLSIPIHHAGDTTAVRETS